MKVEFPITRGLKEIVWKEKDEGFWFWLCSSIIPIITGTVITVLTGGNLLMMISLPILLWFIEMVISIVLYSISNQNTYLACFYGWIPSILLSPITFTYDISYSVFKGVKEYSKKKKVRDKVSSLLTKGLCPKEIEVDHIEGCIEMTSGELAERLFLEVISDQLDRKPMKKGSSKEKLKVIKHQKNGSGFFLIGNFISTQDTQRGDGAENSKTKGRVFAIHFAYSPQTEIFRVKYHTSKCISQVETENDIEDMWGDLMMTSGNPCEDFWERRKSRFINKIDEETGVIIESNSEDSRHIPKQQTELT